MTYSLETLWKMTVFKYLETLKKYLPISLEKLLQYISISKIFQRTVKKLR